MTRHILLCARIFAVTGGAKSTRKNRVQVVTTGPLSTWGIDAKSPSGELTIETPRALSGRATATVSGPDGFHLPLARLIESGEKHFGLSDVRCEEKKYVVLTLGAVAYCELWAADDADRLLREGS